MVRQMWHSQMGPDADFTRIVQEEVGRVEVRSRSASNTGIPS